MNVLCSWSQPQRCIESRRGRQALDIENTAVLKLGHIKRRCARSTRPLTNSPAAEGIRNRPHVEVTAVSWLGDNSPSANRCTFHDHDRLAVEVRVSDPPRNDIARRQRRAPVDLRDIPHGRIVVIARFPNVPLNKRLRVVDILLSCDGRSAKQLSAIPPVPIV